MLNSIKVHFVGTCSPKARGVSAATIGEDRARRGFAGRRAAAEARRHRGAPCPVPYARTSCPCSPGLSGIILEESSYLSPEQISGVAPGHCGHRGGAGRDGGAGGRVHRHAARRRVRDLRGDPERGERAPRACAGRPHLLDELPANSSMSSRGRKRSRGISHDTFTSSSPLPLPRSSAIPLPLQTEHRPLCVPGRSDH